MHFRSGQPPALSPRHLSANSGPSASESLPAVFARIKSETRQRHKDAPSSGLGEATAVMLAERGAKVVLIAAIWIAVVGDTAAAGIIAARVREL